MEVKWKTIQSNQINVVDKLKQKDLIVEKKKKDFIIEYGLLKNLVVYKEDNGYVIVDGNELYLAATRMGVKKFKCTIVEKKDANYIRVMLNLLSYKNDLVQLAALIHQLSQKEMKTLPFSADMIETFRTLLEFDWNKYHKDSTNENQGSLF